VKLMWLCLFLTLPAFAQDEAPEPSPTPDAPAEPSVETEEQKNARAVSLRDLQQADDRLDEEREVLSKTQRRIEMLLEDLENRARALDTKETAIRDLLAQNAATEDDGPIGVPQVQVDYWDKRNPNIAAKDFALLYINEPKVAVDIIKRMKKKTSAALIDEVAKVAEDGINGTEIAASLNEAVGTGRLDKS